MPNQHHIVVHDPSNEYWQGSLVEADRMRQLTARGVVTLPVEPNLFKLSGVGGFAYRAWGAGVPLDGFAPRMVCPMTVYCVKAHRYVHWAARLVASEEMLAKIEAGEKPEGQFRFAADSGQVNPNFATLTLEGKPFLARELGAPDDEGGWVVRGHALLNAGSDAHFPFAFYGAVPGLRVAWAAVSQAANAQ